VRAAADRSPKEPPAKEATSPVPPTAPPDAARIGAGLVTSAEATPEIELPMDGQHMLLLLHQCSATKPVDERAAAMAELYQWTADSKGARHLLASLGGVEALIEAVGDGGLSADCRSHAGVCRISPRVNAGSTRPPALSPPAPRPAALTLSYLAGSEHAINLMEAFGAGAVLTHMLRDGTPAACQKVSSRGTAASDPCDPDHLS